MSDATLAGAPRPAMPGRLWIYLSEMFPLGKHVPLLLVSFLGLYGCLQALAGEPAVSIDGTAAIGFFSYFGVSLIMRVFDEFKDRDLDRILFPRRPLPRGAVHPSDLVVLGGMVFAVSLLLNLREGWVLWVYLAAMGFAWLTYKWFFMEERHRANLLLSFVTHQPLGLFVNAYVLAIAWHDLRGAPPETVPASWLLPLFAFFFPVGAWETSRKIRAPEQETAYVTYSSLLGPRRAALLPLGFVILTAGLLIRLSALLGFSAWAIWGIGLVALGHAAVCLRFILAPSAANNRLRPATEAAAGLVFALFLLQLFTRRAIILFGWSL